MIAHSHDSTGIYFKEPRKALVVKSMAISNTPGDANPLGNMLSRSVTRYPAAAECLLYPEEAVAAIPESSQEGQRDTPRLQKQTRRHTLNLGSSSVLLCAPSTSNIWELLGPFGA